MDDTLPTPKEIRRALALEKKQAKHEAYLRRFRARQILFGQAGGKTKNLSHKDRIFVLSVEHEAYERYLLAWHTGANHWEQGKKWHRQMDHSNGVPMSFYRWRRRWWGGNFARFTRRDVPLLMGQKFKEMQSGRDPEMR